MKQFDAVLFDWMLTLAHYPTAEEHLSQAFRRLDRYEDPAAMGEIVSKIMDARNHPNAKAASLVEDTSPEAHAYSEFLVYELAGLDDELADALYELLGTPEFHLPYRDSKPVLKALKAAGIATGVVSDIHTDLRVHAQEFGWAELIDSW
jgi:FMN phosphatase YigB (HAD superfamily)